MPEFTRKIRDFFESDRNRALLFTLIPFAYWIIAGFKSVEFYSDDDVEHYMMARFAIKHPMIFLDVWGRPVTTLLYCPGSQFGFLGARLTSAILGAATCYICYLYAKNRGYSMAYLVPALLAISRFNGMCYNLDTALPEALVLSAALLLLSQGRYALSALVISLAPAARPEAVLFVVGFAAYFAYKKRFSAVPLTLAGMFLWNFIYFVISGDPLWLMHNQPWSKPYNYDIEFLHYFKRLTEIVGTYHLPFFLIGMLFCVRYWKKDDRGLLFALWFAYFWFLTIACWLNMFSTTGFTRYFSGTMPLVALIALDGLNWLTESEVGVLDAATGALLVASAVFLGLNSAAGYGGFIIACILAVSFKAAAILWKSGRVAVRITAFCLLLWLMLQPFPTLKFPELSPEHKSLKILADWYRQNANGRYVLCSEIRFNAFIDVDLWDSKKYMGVTRENLAKAPAGSIIVWEPHYAGGERYGNIPLEELAQNPAYRLVYAIEDPDLAPNYVFEKTANSGT